MADKSSKNIQTVTFGYGAGWIFAFGSNLGMGQGVVESILWAFLSWLNVAYNFGKYVFVGG